MVTTVVVTDDAQTARRGYTPAPRRPHTAIRYAKGSGDDDEQPAHGYQIRKGAVKSVRKTPVFTVFR